MFYNIKKVHKHAIAYRYQMFVKVAFIEFNRREEKRKEILHFLMENLQIVYFQSEKDYH
jgi:hypothetical protein